MSTQMLHAGISRHALIAVSGALAAGWLLAGCGNGDDSVTDNQTTTETTETTSETTEGENTIEVPSPDIDVPSPDVDMPSVDVPSPEMPEVTPSPVP